MEDLRTSTIRSIRQASSTDRSSICRSVVEPLFLENGVDVVFSGHEHFYERLKPQKGIVYITQGGAAKLRRGNIRDNSPMTAKGFDTDRSFTLVEIIGDHLFFETISRLGQIVDSGEFPRRETSPSPHSQHLISQFMQRRILIPPSRLRRCPESVAPRRCW